MEIPTCVLDASALVEHIQEIKSWIQHGRLRLVVPLCTMENVNQLWAKEKILQEQRETTSSNRRSAGKPARREQPAYDINPRVTLEFLDRLQAENRDALVFQQLGEEYSPWKGVEIPPERKDVKEERPATFAQAARYKQNATNGMPEVPGTIRAPVKAKLVARASATNIEPWRLNKNAPKISQGTVPKLLRPLLSYTLWRLYESHNAGGVGISPILLTNNPVTYTQAQKLTITAKTILEIRQLIASMTVTVDLNSWGELEQEFGRREPKATASEINGKNFHERSTVDTGDQSSDVDRLGDAAALDPTKNGDLTPKDTVVGVPEVTSSISKMEELSVVSEERKIVHESPTKAGSAVHAQKIEEPDQISLNGIGHEMTVDTISGSASASTPLEKEKTKMSEKIIAPNFQPATNQVNHKQPTEDGFKTPVMTSEIVTNGRPIPTTMENGALRSGFVSPERKPSPPQDTPSQNRQCSSPLGASSGSMPGSPRPSSETNSLSTAEAQEPEDSDEEVVVFNPRAKRWSSQSKPTKNVSQPTTPAKTLNSRNAASGFETPPSSGSSNHAIATPSSPGHAQNSPLSQDQALRNQAASEQSPRDQIHRNQTLSEQGSRNHSPRSHGPRNRSPRNQTQRKQGRPNQAPQNRAPPAIIDPDFFGRSPAVNIHPNGQNGQARYFQRGTTRRGPRAHEPEVEYVLTSGATREASRGKGKLWVP